MTMKRRDALKTLGALAGAATMSKFLTACGGGDGETGINTLVFMMMENRSYDHYLGYRKMLNGTTDDGLDASMANPDVNDVDLAVWKADNDSMCVLDPPHGWDASREQFNAGANDGFLKAHQARHGASAIEAMQYMTAEHIPVTAALADQYTVCDKWFSSVLGPTLPNRMYWHTGTSGGAKDNDTVLNGAYEGVNTLYHNLDAAGVDWAYYYGDVPVLSVLDGIPTEGRVKRFLYEFVDDAAAGKLPPVVYIDPSFSGNDDHPPHHPLLGQQLISSVYNMLATSPQWKNCMLVVTYDEHGGFYDHVAPPKAPDERAAEGFDQLGFRVPTIVAGPYAKQSYVSSVQYDHTSALKHVENVFGLAPLTMRSSAANDLTDCLDLARLEAGQPADPITMPAVEIDEENLPDSCRYELPLTKFDHEIVEWAAANTHKLGKLDRRHETKDYIYGIGDYLDKHNLGRIKRRGRKGRK